MHTVVDVDVDLREGSVRIWNGKRVDSLDCKIRSRIEETARPPRAERPMSRALTGGFSYMF